MEAQLINAELVLPTHFSFKRIQIYEKYPKVLGYCHCMYSKWLAPTIDYWQPPFSMVRQPTMPNLAAMFDSRTSGAAAMKCL